MRPFTRSINHYAVVKLKKPTSWRPTPSNQQLLFVTEAVSEWNIALIETAVRWHFPLTEMLFTHDRFCRRWPLTETVNGNCLVWHPLKRRLGEELWNFRSRVLSLPGANFRSLELSLPGTFVPGSENDVELLLPNIIYVLTCWNLALYFVCLLDCTLT